MMETPQTKVVNIHTGERYDVDISRASIWGNPFSHKKNTKAKYVVKTREEAIARYADWIVRQPHLMVELKHLKGKVLGCTCKPKACHGDILVALINTEVESKNLPHSV